ncbi:MAG: aminoacyl-tRNA hydrolase [Rhodospirillales bacterium]
MRLWVGLGNPEPGKARKPAQCRFHGDRPYAHDHGFGPWRQRFRGVVAEGQLGGERIIALKPLTYMNNSGESVQPAAAFYKLPTDAITVFYDELDLAPGRVRVKRAGGAAGHNGLRSMDKMLGTQDYWRVRIGIGHPGDKARVLGHVLGNKSAEDQEWPGPGAGRAVCVGAAAGGGSAGAVHDQGGAAGGRRLGRRKGRLGALP